MIDADRGPRPARRIWRALVAAALASALGLFPAAPEAQRGSPKRPAPARQAPPKDDRLEIFRGEDALARTYDLILDANFAQADATLDRGCAAAPDEACDVLAATALWWRIQLDPGSRALDEDFSAAVDRAIATTNAWTARAPDDAEGWFYLGAAYAARVQWQVLRDEKLAAARDGKRIKEALERALALNPELDDAYFGIGMYRYYADVAPAAARFLRFLLLLPGGNRKEGLAQMLRARERGHLLQGEADYQLHIIYLWYERRTDRALELLDSLRDRYPANPLFPTQIAEITDTYQHDVTASLEAWRTLLRDARGGRLHAAPLAETRARLGIAQHLETLALTDEAIDELDRVIAVKPGAPYSALALAYYRRGLAHDRMNARSDAIESYRLAAEAAPADDPHGVRRDAAERLRKTPNAAHAEAFRLSLEGLRRLEQKDLDAAASALERSLALNGRDAIAHYRYGRVLIARREAQRALTQFELALRDARTCPPPILGQIYLESGQLYERLGQRDQAKNAYTIAATLFGASADTHHLAARALSRLQ